jgi:hypothetical protein
VTDGIVTLEGHLDSIAVGRGIVAEIRRLEGVVAELDRLTRPVTGTGTGP